MTRLLRNLSAILLAFLPFIQSPVLAQSEPPQGLELVQAATLVVRSDDLEEALLGSAFRFLRAGIVVTNAHVVGANRTVLLVANDGSRRIGQVVAVDRLRDIAVIKVADAGVFLRTTTEARLGQDVFAMGAPYGAEFSLTRGAISRLARQIEANVPIYMLQHDAPVNPGSSGGPLVDRRGALLGMNSQIADGFRNFIGIAYAIPAPKLAAVVEGLLAGKAAQIPDLGLRLRAVTTKAAFALDLTVTNGVLIDNVRPNGLADQAGLKAGDIILALGGAVINTPGDMAFALEDALGGSQIKVNILRGKWRFTLNLSLVLAPDETANPPRAKPRTTRDYALSETGLTLEPAGRISAVTKGSLANYTGLSGGDVILAINGRTVTMADNWLENLRISRPALLLVALSDGSTRHFILDPWQKPGRLMPVSGANVLDEAVVIF